MFYRVLFGFLSLSVSAAEATNWEWHVAQKIMVSMRYYCDNEHVKALGQNECRQPMTTLPPVYAQLIEKSAVGGVILFADNLVDVKQARALVAQLQAAALRAHRATPLLIAIDQEGGRVSRLPNAESAIMPGNMAIGATYETHRETFSVLSANAIAQQLRVIGVNMNLAPTVDINSNPDNPVINVRSFGESPQQVARLGVATAETFRRLGVIPVYKHFPGHGDTEQDSHTGLPRILHSLEQLQSTDAFPFAYAIKQQAVDVIMTAHIQFPVLDQTVLDTRFERQQIVAPATLSRIIINDYLRDTLRFNGVVISDALDMAAIQNYFTPEQTLRYAFLAGVDVALMPLSLQTDADVNQLQALIQNVATWVKQGGINQAELIRSSRRVSELKKAFKVTRKHFHRDGTPRSRPSPLTLDALTHYRQQEQAIADAAATLIKNDGVLPVAELQRAATLLIMPSQELCQALVRSLQKFQWPTVNCQSLLSLSDDIERQVSNCQVIVVGSISPQASLAELGNWDDLASYRTQSDLQQQLRLNTERVFALINSEKKKHVVASLRAPYDLRPYLHNASAAMALYNYHVYHATDAMPVHSVAMETLAKLLSGTLVAGGALPVTLSSL